VEGQESERKGHAVGGEEGLARAAKRKLGRAERRVDGDVLQHMLEGVGGAEEAREERATGAERRAAKAWVRQAVGDEGGGADADRRAVPLAVRARVRQLRLRRLSRLSALRSRLRAPVMLALGVDPLHGLHRLRQRRRVHGAASRAHDRRVLHLPLLRSALVALPVPSAALCVQGGGHGWARRPQREDARALSE
jgi:hypothetical protein